MKNEFKPTFDTPPPLNKINLLSLLSTFCCKLVRLANAWSNSTNRKLKIKLCTLRFESIVGLIFLRIDVEINVEYCLRDRYVL